ncbi:hypothetical protein EDB84DRAFT_1440952 [Lactarius hengduanensis]|nr:hypothetical protein EDB84DRAFT_1440952 [Lactarius hengduanensis]
MYADKMSFDATAPGITCIAIATSSVLCHFTNQVCTREPSRRSLYLVPPHKRVTVGQRQLQHCASSLRACKYSVRQLLPYRLLCPRSDPPTPSCRTWSSRRLPRHPGSRCYHLDSDADSSGDRNDDDDGDDEVTMTRPSVTTATTKCATKTTAATTVTAMIDDEVRDDEA